MSLGRRPLLLPRWSHDRLWTAARAVPSLDQDFASTRSLVDRISGLQLITFTRASSATVTGPTGLVETVADNVPRFQHDPTTGQCLGLLVEEQRTNLLLNSATLSTQSVTTAATAYTLSFYGTGTVTLSGTSTAGPLVGTGANARVSLTFTPTAGTLTLTVSGSVTSANLEAGSFATSWIPSLGTSATRSADVATITGTAFSRWYNAAGGTSFANYAFLSTAPTSGFPSVYGFTDGTANNRIAPSYLNDSSNALEHFVGAGGVNQSVIVGPAYTAGAGARTAMAFFANDFAVATNGGSVATDNSGTIPTVNVMNIGNQFGSFTMSGTISRLTYWPTRLSNAVLHALTR
jgi:hypothetical protein